MSYAIHCTPNFYAGDIFGSDKPHLRTAPVDGSIIALRREEDAQIICNMLNDYGAGPYVLAHNQFAPPEHRPQISDAPAITLASAMEMLGLQYDFAPDGSRLPVGGSK